MEYRINNETGSFEIRTLADGIFRFRYGKHGLKEPLLTKYKIIDENFGAFESSFEDNVIKAGKFSIKTDFENGVFIFSGGKKDIEINVFDCGKNNSEKGFSIGLSVDKNEKFYGFGDENRDSLQKRGKKIKIWERNITAYGPIPFMLSSFGYGITVNCTFEHYFDLCSEDKDKVLITSEKGVADFYVFIGNRMTDVLRLYTDLTGKPIMLPKFAYGMTFVNNESDDLRDLLEDCSRFRMYDIPCDVMGLEPNWMSKHYDLSTEKEWNKDKFYIANWNNNKGPQTMFYNLRALGYKLSLWLCNDYDLFYEEEKNCCELTENEYGNDAEIVDEHFFFDMINDKITKSDEAWFEHLKKFTDQGAAVYKLDGAYQVLKHPDRLWGGKYHDDEIHNLYPVVYAKQMKEGFEKHTGRRAMIYTPCAYTGIQKYAASWTGDTGGGPKTLMAVLNQAMCAHTNVTCSFNSTNAFSIHYGFLLPWTHFESWRSYHHPWFLPEKLRNLIRTYSKLRSELFPYIYSTAHNAASTGVPIARPICLAYPEKENADEIKNEYMLGESLLVGAFEMELDLPEGIWIDYWTNKKYSGGQKIKYEIPEGKSGALLVKEGSVFVTQEPMKYLCEKNPEYYYLNVYPGGDCRFELIEDDGITYDYLNGKMAITEFEIKNSSHKAFELIVRKRKGGFDGSRCDYEYDEAVMSENDPSNIPSLPDVVDFKVRIYTSEKVKQICLGDEKLDFSAIQNGFSFVIPKELHNIKDLSYKIITE